MIIIAVGSRDHRAFFLFPLPLDAALLTALACNLAGPSAPLDAHVRATHPSLYCRWNAKLCRHVSPALIEIEAQTIADATDRGIWDDGGEMRVRCSASSRQASPTSILHEVIRTLCLHTNIYNPSITRSLQFRMCQRV